MTRFSPRRGKSAVGVEGSASSDVLPERLKATGRGNACDAASALPVRAQRSGHPVGPATEGEPEPSIASDGRGEEYFLRWIVALGPCSSGDWIGCSGSGSRPKCSHEYDCVRSCEEDDFVPEDTLPKGAGRHRGRSARERAAQSGRGAAPCPGTWLFGNEPRLPSSASAAPAHVFVVGDRVQVLPGCSQSDNLGQQLYVAGDEGTIMQVDEGSAKKERLEIVWSRTGLKTWEDEPHGRFEFVTRQTLAIGDLLVALPGRTCSLAGVELCTGGDEVTIARFGKSKTQEPLVEVVCSRTGKSCSVAQSSWMNVFRYDHHQVLEVGDIIVALPCVQPVFDSSGTRVYSEGDEGSVTKFCQRQRASGNADSPSGPKIGRWRDAEERMEVFWAGSGRTTDESAPDWMRYFRMKRAADPSWPNRFTRSSQEKAGAQRAAIEGASCAAERQSSPSRRVL